MAKATPDAVLDALLDSIAASTILHVCSAQPADFAGIAAVTLADVVIDGTDFVKADAAGGGRQVTVGAQNAVPVDTTGTATHVVLAVSASSLLKQVTTCTSQALTAGNTVNVPAYVISVGDPT